MNPDFGETVGSTDFVFLLPDGSKKVVQSRVGRPVDDDEVVVVGQGTSGDDADIVLGSGPA